MQLVLTSMLCCMFNNNTLNKFCEQAKLLPWEIIKAFVIISKKHKKTTLLIKLNL